MKPRVLIAFSWIWPHEVFTEKLLRSLTDMQIHERNFIQNNQSANLAKGDNILTLDTMKKICKGTRTKTLIAFASHVKFLTTG